MSSQNKLRFVTEAVFCMDANGHCLEGAALKGLLEIVEDICMTEEGHHDATTTVARDGGSDRAA